MVPNPEQINVLIIGGGAREHVIGWQLKNDGVKNLYFAPGNAGTAQIGQNVDLDWKNFSAVLSFLTEYLIDLTVIGPEEPLSLGLVDFLRENQQLVVGPTKRAAQLETSKVFARDLMAITKIPQPNYYVCCNLEQVEQSRLRLAGFPVVLKVDGLAAGKGAYVCHDQADWDKAVKEIFTDKKFGAASEKVLVEECLIGEELSVFAICDGQNYKIIGTAQDHKRLGNGDTGPNTGGMGAYSPTPLATPELLQKTEEKILKPILAVMEQLGFPFTGFLYLGLMLVNGEPYVIEFNVRLGDPEAQVIVPNLLPQVFFKLLFASAQGNLGEFTGAVTPEKPKWLVAVVKAAGGYPDKYRKGDEIFGLNGLSKYDWVFQAGTAIKDGRIVTSGGRVLCPVGCGNSLHAAIQDVYSLANLVYFEGEYMRDDIGERGLGYLKTE